jgi:hypothetical protein
MLPLILSESTRYKKIIYLEYLQFVIRSANLNLQGFVLPSSLFIFSNHTSFLPLIRQLAEDVFNVTCKYFSYRLQVVTVFYYLNASGFWKRLKVIRVPVKPYFLLR